MTGEVVAVPGMECSAPLRLQPPAGSDPAARSQPPLAPGWVRWPRFPQLVRNFHLPGGQRWIFANGRDLPFFLDRLADGCGYRHLPVLAPSPEILGDYRQDHDWTRYVRRFEALMDDRNIPGIFAPEEFAAGPTCLLCSEHEPDQCHRRLVAERLQRAWGGLEIVHLV
jgi:hypothetical protein